MDPSHSESKAMIARMFFVVGFVGVIAWFMIHWMHTVDAAVTAFTK